jgi:hypothetical protein
MREATKDLLAVFDSLDNTLTDIIFGLRDGTLLPDQQVRLAKLFEAVALLLEAHAAVVLRDIVREKAAKEQAQPPTRGRGRTTNKKP